MSKAGSAGSGGNVGAGASGKAGSATAVLTPDGIRLLVVAEDADARDGFFTVCLQ